MTSASEAAERQQAAIRRDMDAGTTAADMIWNANRRRLTDGFFAGLIIKLLSLYAAQTTPETMAKVYESCSRAVKSLHESTQVKQ